MKIKSISFWKENLGLSVPYSISYKTVDSVENAFVKLECEEGIVGYGACNPSEQVVGEDVSASFQLMQAEDWGWIEGRDLREMKTLCRELQGRYTSNPGVRCAVDIALYDAFTQFLKVPLASYLGKCMGPLATSVTIGIMNVEETTKKGKEFVDQGFKTLKVKLGNDLDEDIERLGKLREALGNSVIIRVDANQGYTIDECTKFIKETEHLSIELIEQPLPVHDDDQLENLPSSAKERLAADESLVSIEDAMNLQERYGIFNIKLMKCGGITPGRDIAYYGLWKDIDLMWGCNDESKISIAAALHLAYSCPNTKYIDLDGSLDLAEDVVTGGFTLEEGYMHLTNAPGLGVQADQL